MTLLRRFKSYNHFVLHNKQCHRKVLLCSFHLNGNTLGFYPRTLTLKPPSIVLAFNSSISLAKLKLRPHFTQRNRQHRGELLLSSVCLNYTFLQFFKIALYSRSPNFVGPGGRCLKVPVTFLARKAVLCLPFLHSRSTSQ